VRIPDRFRSRRPALLALALTLAASGGALSSATAAPAQLADPGPTLGFTHAVTVDPQRLAGEPDIAIADNARELYTSAPWGFSTTTSFAWKTEDGGAQWDLLRGCAAGDQHLTCSRGGGDTEIQVGSPHSPGDPQAVYYADLNSLDSLTCAYSYDGGDTWNIAGTSPDAAVPGVPGGGEACNVGTSQPPGSDRQWIAVWPKAYNGTANDILYMAFDTGETPPSNDSLVYSLDAGQTWRKGATLYQGPTNYPTGNTNGIRPGPLVINKKTGTLYQFYELTTGGALVDVSCDGGMKFHQYVIKPAGGSSSTNDFVAGAIDTDGNLYAVWTVSNGAQFPTSSGSTTTPYKLFYSHSTDGDSTPANCSRPERGKTWSTPIQLNYTYTSDGKVVNSPAPNVTEAVMPWITAGDPGRVDIVYYGTTKALPYNPNSQAAPWHVHMSQSTNARDAAPTFTDAQVTEQPMHNSSICFNGIGCSATQGNRNLADFFQVQVDPEGRADIIYTDDNNSAAATPNGSVGAPVVHFIQQSSGPSLYNSAGGGTGYVAGPVGSLAQSADRRSIVTDAEGDAMVPAHATRPYAKSLQNIKAADITKVQVLPKDATTLKLLIDVKDLGSGPTSAIVQGPTPHTGAQWMVTWRAKNDVWFAAAAVDESGTPKFFAGKPQSEPLTGGGPKALGYIAGPNTTAVTGAFDNANDRIEIDVPLSAVSAAAGDVLYGVQGFTLETVGAQGDETPFADQADATAPITTVLDAGPTSDVPEVPQTALMLIAGLLVVAAAVVIRRRARA
jgi:hypothetical protein